MDIKDIRRKALPLLKRRAVKRAGIFGSSVRTGETPRDVDMLVEMPRPYGLFKFLSLKGELEDTLGMKVDLVEYANLKPQIRERILKEAVSIL